MMESLLLEIGTEEIPAGYIAPALAALSATLSKKLTAARIEHGEIRTYATPRRLALIADKVAASQSALTEEVTGPPASVGFDADGNPTMAAKKFAEKLGLNISEITVKETKKGKYLAALKTEETLATSEILKGILPETILATPFPKTMRWADLDINFARPIQTVLALFGGDVVPFTLGNLESGRISLGHRFMHPSPITIDAPEEYVEKLKGAWVMADMGERRALVAEGLEKAATEAGGKMIPDEELVDTVTSLVEYPFVATGNFDAEFLEVPEEALIMAMREHQKYFAVVDDGGKLMPCFLVVNNTNAADLGLVARGHERVLRARLSDAQFFYRVDLKVSQADMAEKLKKVLFQKQLGTIHQKVERIEALSDYLAVAAEKADLAADLAQAAKLCKTDLVSQMVIEFTKLQGVMGRVYALAAGENETVAAAIEEHWRPTYSGGPIPTSEAAALLSIADKIDTICGCFSADLIPTGASDPYALRRQGIGIVQIMHQKGFSFSLTALIEKGIALYGDRDQEEIQAIAAKVYAFLKDRMTGILREEGYSKDAIAAVAAVSADNVPALWNRVAALEKLKGEADFEPLAVAFKRVVNIIKKAKLTGPMRVEASLFEKVCEADLMEAVVRVHTSVTEKLEEGAYDEALMDIASLRAPVDAFFEGVMVMAEDEKIRNNRLAILKEIADLFAQFADFSKI